MHRPLGAHSPRAPHLPVFARAALLVFLASSALVLSHCAPDTRSRPSLPGATAGRPLPQTPDGRAVKVLKGFGVSPQGFPVDWSRLPGFLKEVGSMPNGAVLWNGPWRDDVVAGGDAGRAPSAAVTMLKGAASYHYVPILVFGWRTGETLHVQVPGAPANDWTNAQARSLFRQTLVALAEAHKPPFIFLGNENDFYFQQNPTDYANWIGFYNEAYDAIKGVSPTTTIGPVFSYEHMAGLGGLNGWTTPHWGALGAHDLARVDVVGITLYPWLHYARADAVRADHLAPLLSHIAGKPIAITETGWPAERLGDLNPPWEASEAAQATYISRLTAMLQGRDARLVSWLFLHPMSDPGGSPLAWKLFGSVSLRDRTGREREAYRAWLGLSP